MTDEEKLDKILLLLEEIKEKVENMETMLHLEGL